MKANRRFSVTEHWTCDLCCGSGQVYEDASEPGLFVEFTEARDVSTLTAARVSVFDSDPGAPILTEVELS